jgi:hypothetical protein
MLYSFFWVIAWRLNSMCRRFGTICPIFIGRVNKNTTYEDGTECSETSAHKIQAPGNPPKETTQHLQHGESFEVRNIHEAFRHQEEQE